VVRDAAALKNALGDGSPVVLVPTMGALHRGHLSLVETARQAAGQNGQNGKVVVSIYVNPLQFAPNEDFDTYPRDLETDCEKLAGLADVIFAPENLYPDKQTVHFSLPSVADELCGKSRPGFFYGVAMAVCKLFNIVRPDAAVFGLKDFQQAHIIQLLTKQLNYPIDIITAPTVREKDGLAMSSRNAYLNAEDRRRAAALPKALNAAAEAVESGTPPAEAAAEAARQLADAGFAVDYVEARDYATLGAPGKDKIVILAAAVLASARLIDNISCTPK